MRRMSAAALIGLFSASIAHSAPCDQARVIAWYFSDEDVEGLGTRYSCGAENDPNANINAHAALCPNGHVVGDDHFWAQGGGNCGKQGWRAVCIPN
jgi:hypothetical protein